MKRGAYLINTSRGGLIDEAALISALESGHLAAAALDVFETEPLPAGHPLSRLKNVVLTPHIAAGTRDALTDKDARAVRQRAAFLSRRAARESGVLTMERRSCALQWRGPVSPADCTWRAGSGSTTPKWLRFAIQARRRPRRVRASSESPQCSLTPKQMLAAVKPDAIDIVAPMDAHVSLCHVAADRGVDILCQKPLAPSLEQARSLAHAPSTARCD